METVQIGDLRFVVAPEPGVVQERRRFVPDPRPKQKTKVQKEISQAKQILARARAHKMESVRLVGRGGLIDQPTKLNGWLVMPPEMYRGIIPRQAWDAAETLTRGIAIKGFLIADDQRSLTRKPQNPTVVEPRRSINWGKVASGAGWAVAAIAAVGAIISFFPLVLGIGVVGAALAYDPLLIAVTAEDEWICLYEWWH